MSFVKDLVTSVVTDVLNDMLKKTNGAGKRTRRRKRAPSTTGRLNRIEKMLKPAKKQTSRKRTVRARSKVKRRAY